MTNYQFFLKLNIVPVAAVQQQQQQNAAVQQQQNGITQLSA
jgi:hypothetical protein